jgi:AraC-like DNA-binding protein
MDPAGMVYERFPAPADMDAYLEHVWAVRAPAFREPRQEILIPSGRPTIVVCLADPGVRRDPLTGAAHPNGTVMFGITTRPYVLEQVGPSWYVGAQLTPWGLAALLPGRWLVDDFRRVEEWLGPAATRGLEDDLRVAAGRGGDAGTAAALAGHLARRAVPIAPQPLAALRHAVTAVDDTRGTITVAELATRLDRSHAAVYRLFRGHLGVGPKQFCEIVRYYHFAGGLLARHRGDSGALLASLHGYYDQAHAARDFRRFTGVSAGTFQRVNHGIARLMHAHDSYKTS